MKDWKGHTSLCLTHLLNIRSTPGLEIVILKLSSKNQWLVLTVIFVPFFYL